MKVSGLFPSNYLRAADLNGQDVTVVVDKITVEDIGDDTKPVVYFRGKKKGLVLNKTNASNIAIAYGDDTEDWVGQEIILYPTLVDFQGRSVEAIRVKLSRKKRSRPPTQNNELHDDQPTRQEGDMDDEIPF